MRRFQVHLDGIMIANGYQCNGHYDVANHLFPGPDGFAKVASVDRTDGRYELVLLDYHNAHMVITPLR